MTPQKSKQPKLTLIQGGLGVETFLGSVRILVTSDDPPLSAAQAVVFEEDTFLVLSADPVVRNRRENLLRLMTELNELQPVQPGSVLTRGRRPLKFLATVHDLNQDPTWREEWVLSALEGVFREAEERKLRSLALPLLGTLHGSLKKARFISLLKTVMTRISPQHLKLLWLKVPAGTTGTIIKLLKKDEP